MEILDGLGAFTLLIALVYGLVTFRASLKISEREHKVKQREQALIQREAFFFHDPILYHTPEQFFEPKRTIKHEVKGQTQIDDLLKTFS